MLGSLVVLNVEATRSYMATSEDLQAPAVYSNNVSFSSASHEQLGPDVLRRLHETRRRTYNSSKVADLVADGPANPPWFSAIKPNQDLAVRR